MEPCERPLKVDPSQNNRICLTERLAGYEARLNLPHSRARKPHRAPRHSAAMLLSPEITRPIHADGRPMPTAEQPAATGKHVTPTRVIPTRVIPMGMDVPVSLPMMPLYAIVMGDSGRHKHQRANYSGDEANSV